MARVTHITKNSVATQDFIIKDMDMAKEVMLITRGSVAMPAMVIKEEAMDIMVVMDMEVDIVLEVDMLTIWIITRKEMSVILCIKTIDDNRLTFLFNAG